MGLRSTSFAWGAVARLLHWTMLALFLAIFPLGLYMADLPLGVHKLRLYALHKSIGLTLLALALLRFAWRLLDRRPELPPMPAWQLGVARLTHILLYVLMFAVPVSGWMFNSAAGFPLQWFGLVNLPAIAHSSPSLKQLAHTLHEAGAWLLVALAVLHAAGALTHHFVSRDRTLTLMVPWLRAPGTGGKP